MLLCDLWKKIYPFTKVKIIKEDCGGELFSSYKVDMPMQIYMNLADFKVIRDEEDGGYLILYIGEEV